MNLLLCELITRFFIENILCRKPHSLKPSKVQTPCWKERKKDICPSSSVDSKKPLLGSSILGMGVFHSVSLHGKGQCKQCIVYPLRENSDGSIGKRNEVRYGVWSNKWRGIIGVVHGYEGFIHAAQVVEGPVPIALYGPVGLGDRVLLSNEGFLVVDEIRSAFVNTMATQYAGLHREIQGFSIPEEG